MIIKTTNKTPKKHNFITKFTGKSDVMKNLLNPPGRFGTTAELTAQTDEINFIQYLLNHQFTFTNQLTTILQHYIPIPTQLTTQNINTQIFYSNISYYLGSYRQQNPQQFTGYTTNYQPDMMTKEIDERV